MAQDDYDDYESNESQDQSDIVSQSQIPIQDEDEEEDEIQEENQSQSDQQQQIMHEKDVPIYKSNTQKITPPFLTKYEKARIIGVRAMQISRNAPIYVDPGEDIDPLLIAQKELIQGKIPFTIRRYLPDNSYEDWPIKQLKTIN